jgi:hypothetical protein
MCNEHQLYAVYCSTINKQTIYFSMFNYKKMFIINLDMNLEWFLCGMATSILISLATCIRLAQPNNGVR